MSHELIALLMFSSLMLMLLTGQRVFGAVGFVAAAASLRLAFVSGVQAEAMNDRRQRECEGDGPESQGAESDEDFLLHVSSFFTCLSVKMTISESEMEARR